VLGCRHHEQIRRPQPRQEQRQAGIESLEIRRVPGGIVAMAVHSVEVHKVCEDQAATRIRHGLFDAIHSLLIACGRHGVSDTATGEKILDLANRDHWHAAVVEEVEQRVRRWFERIVMPVGGAPEPARCAHEWPGNDASNPEPSRNEIERHLADAVLLGYRNDLFVRGDLEHAVGRRIDDRLGRRHVFSPQALDDFGA
jgi:hypothetical protein